MVLSTAGGEYFLWKDCFATLKITKTSVVIARDSVLPQDTFGQQRPAKRARVAEQDSEVELRHKLTKPSS
jgi:hypothetical protein